MAFFHILLIAEIFPLVFFKEVDQHQTPKNNIETDADEAVSVAVNYLLLLRILLPGTTGDGNSDEMMNDCRKNFLEKHSRGVEK